MKSYTDLEQSKKLAEILPTESADMIYPPMMDIDSMSNSGFFNIPECYPFNEFKDIDTKPLPCWNLSKLLDVLESEIDGEEGETYQLNIEKDGTWWNVWYRELYDEANPIETESTEELVDACVEMIEKLHEQKLL